jgi:hypothetical protein
LFRDQSRITDAAPVDPTTREAMLNWDHLQGPNEQRLMVVADFNETLAGGDILWAEIVSVQTGGAVFGNLPITGNTVTLDERPAHVIEIVKAGDVPNPQAGTEATVARFLIRTPTFGGGLRAIGFSIGTGTTVGHELWRGDEMVAGCARIEMGSDRIACPFVSALTLEGAGEAELELRAGVSGFAGDPIRVAIDEKSDVRAVDGEFGFRFEIDITRYDDTGDACVGSGSDCSFSSIIP